MNFGDDEPRTSEPAGTCEVNAHRYTALVQDGSVLGDQDDEVGSRDLHRRFWSRMAAPVYDVPVADWFGQHELTWE